MTSTTKMDGSTKIELWEGGGPVRSENIGPALGVHHLGDVTGPGLYMFVAPNAGGKSHHLDLLGKLDDEGALRREVGVVSDGEVQATFEVGQMRVTFRVGLDGKQKPPKVEGTERVRVERMPLPIDVLITGENLKGEDARARRRLEALLSYAPVEVTDELLRRLCRAMEGKKAIAEPLDSLQAVAWRELGREVEGREKRWTAPAFSTAAEVEAGLVDEAPTDILAAHEVLTAALNSLGLAAEKMATLQGERVAGAEARVAAALEDAAERAGIPMAEVAKRLRDAGGEDLAALRAAAGAARDRASELSVEARRRREEEERRVRLRESHGERPDLAEAEAEVERVAAITAAAEEEIATLRARERELSEETIERAGGAVLAERAHTGVWDTFERSVAALRVVYQRAGSAGAGRVELDDAFEAIAGQRGELIEAFTDLRAARERAAAVKRQHDEVRDTKLPEVRARQEQAAADHERAQAALARLRGQMARWEETEQLLAAAVPGPADGAVEQARAAAAEAEAAAAVAELATRHQGLAAGHQREVDLLEWLEAAAAEFRESARDSWVTLGDTVTAALGLPWLRVDGTRIKLLFHRGIGGRLLDAPAPTDAEAMAREVEIRDLDDPKRVSTAELHEAMLRLMLTRRERLGGWLILPWQVPAALDVDRLRRFSAWSRDAGLVTFSERARREGDPADLHLEFVEPLEEAP